MSMFSFLNSKKDEIAIVFDIGSGTLAGALVKFKKDGLPQILYTHRELVVAKRNVDADGLTEAMLKTLDIICAVIIKEGLSALGASKKIEKKIHTIYYVFSSPWVLSQTKTIKIHKDKETLITHDLIESAVKNEEKGFEKLYNDGKFSEKFEYDLDVIERNVPQISLNGYVTHDPFSKYAHTIEIPFFMSVISKNIISKMNAVVSKYFHINKSIAHSCVLLSYLTLRDMFHDEEDFMLIDIHGELTDIGVTKKGVLVETSSFPLGINTITRKVAKELATTPQIAESNIRMFLSGKSDNKTSLVMKSALNTIRREWTDLFHESLSDLNEETVIPQKVFLVVGGLMEKFFADFLAQDTFEQLNMIQDTFDVTVLSEDQFTYFGGPTFKSERDSFLTMHTLALSKFKENRKEQVL